MYGDVFSEKQSIIATKYKTIDMIKKEIENLMLLSPSASKNLANRLLNPSKPNKVLKNAMDEYDEMIKNV